MQVSDEELKAMADRFLGWKLPDNFQPDAGIVYTPYDGPYSYPSPMGTNLFTYTQALEMVKFMVEGLKQD